MPQSSFIQQLGTFLCLPLMESPTVNTNLKVLPDAFLAACPSRELLRVVSGKWAPLVLVALQTGPMRFGELRRAVEGVTQKMLTQTLRQLQRSGLVQRTAYDELPLRVDYRLTSLGQSAVAPIEMLKSWAEKSFRESQQAREAFDSTYGQK